MIVIRKGETPGDAMRREFAARDWKIFARTWSFIGLSECLTHNLLVCVHAADPKERIGAAREVSQTVIAGLVALWRSE